jgi:hypothetical protein
MELESISRMKREPKILKIAKKKMKKRPKERIDFEMYLRNTFAILFKYD